jgi:hypothetical protein
MKLVTGASFVLGLSLWAISGNPAVQAQSVPPINRSLKPSELLSRGQQKAQRGDYRGAIGGMATILTKKGHLI